MITRDPAFPLRQALADLNRQKLALPLATVRRIGAGFSTRAGGSPDLQRRLEWYFSGKVPAADLGRDRLVHGALLMASALPDDDYDCFAAATVLLLVERLSSDGGRDNGFWNWNRLAPHYRLAAPPLRAAIMCGFREARRRGRISLSEGPDAGDCLSAPKEEVLALLGPFPFLERAVKEEVDPLAAGDLWASQHRYVNALPDGARRAALAGFRYLYERPLSMAAPPGAELPVIPGAD